MPSKLGTENEDYEEKIVLDCDGQLRKSFPQQEVFRIPKEFTHRRIPKKKLQDKGNSLKSGKPVEPKSSDQHGAMRGNVNQGGSTPLLHLRNYQKPWPGRKPSGCEELVKHMSNVPCYLQGIDKRDNLQEKALNVGVLDWGRLEKWTHNQRRVANGHTTVMTSPLFSRGLSADSHRSSSSTHSPRKQSPSLKAGRNASTEGCTPWMMEEENSVDSTHEHEKGGVKDSDLKDTFSDGSQRQGDGTSPSKDQSREREKPQCHDVLDIPREWSPDKCVTVTENIEGMWEHPQEEVSGRRSSFKSPAFKDASLIGVKDVQFTDLSPQVPHSCPLPSSVVTDIPDSASTAPYGNQVLTTTLNDKNENQDHFTGLPYELSEVGMCERLGTDETKVRSSVERGLSPGRRYGAGLNWMTRSSSLRQGSSNRQTKETAYSDILIEDKASANSRGRRSPLRRILDPLLKPMSRINFSGPIAVHRVHELKKTDKPLLQESRSTQGPHKSSDGNANASSNPQGSCQKEKHRESMKQALLQLAWKNGLPLLIFSSNDSDVLAATIRKRNDSIKDDMECIYTIFIVHEVKKRSGIWMNHGSKSRGLVSNVVGQIKVSHPKLSGYDLHGHSVMREFVLFGAELGQSSYEPVGPGLSSELAAIVVKDPNEFPEGSYCDMLQSGHSGDSTQKYSAEDNCCNYHAESLKMDLNAESSNLSSILAILPTAVHGLPAEGEPSPLIERWKSGGSCDCGGWDEGCMLTILSDKRQEGKNCDSVEACDGTQRIKLFSQGGYREKQHAFRMVSFKEGLYTVDFEPSIALLQAFAICIASLHCRKSPNHFVVHCFKGAKSFHEDQFGDHARMATPETKKEDTATYVPNHPPLSPFGRA